MRKLFVLIVLVLSLVATSPTWASSTIIKFDLGNVGPDVANTSGVLHTVDDTAGVTPIGDQMTNVDFLTVVGFLPDITNTTASFTLSGVALTGGLNVQPSTITQATLGGSFGLWDANNNLLLSGALTDGVLSVAPNAATGSFFNTTIASFTGGTLLQYLANTPATISISLLNVNFGGSLYGCSEHCIGDFTSDATGLIGGSPIPEPTTMFLFMAGVPLLFGVRRRSSSN